MIHTRFRVFSLLTLLSAAAFAQTIVSKEATGQAAVINKDEPKAIEEATQRALRTALEQAAGVKIDADTLVVNNQLVRDQVFANTSGYVKSYAVTAKAIEKGVATVTVKADVLTDALDKDIDAARTLVRRMGRPSIVILINESTLQLGKGGAAVTTSDVTAAILTQAFKADGWDVKDPAFAAGKLHVAPGATLGQGASKEIADLSKAAYFLYGTATLRNAELESWMKSTDGQQQIFPVTGEYDLSLFSATVGEVISKVSGKLVMQQSTGDTQAAAKKFLVSYERSAFDMIQSRKTEIVDSVRKGVLENFRDVITNGVTVTMDVAGLESFGTAQQFLKSLEAMKSIKSVQQDRFEKGKATYRVGYFGTPVQLAEAVEEATFKKRKIEVTTVNGNKLEVQVAK